jgi:O-acetyl-ADP-ribose deacetylase (regulator of RNase III)
MATAVATQIAKSAVSTSLPILSSTRLPGGGAILDVEGDLMQATDSLCHCVSACLGMGKGIALAFRSNFGNVDKLKAQNIGVGGVAILPRPEENRFIYYLITKPRYSDKPTYDTLRASLKSMIAHMKQNTISSLSIPELGCGLDGLKWDNVFNMLCEEFGGTGINITVYHYRGKGMTAPPTLPNQQQQQQGGAVASAVNNSSKAQVQNEEKKAVEKKNRLQ